MFCNRCGKMLDEKGLCSICDKRVETVIKNNGGKKNNFWDIFISICLSIAIVVLSFYLISFYSYGYVRNKINTVKIPYANQMVDPGVRITTYMVSYMEVPRWFGVGSYYDDIDSIVGKCSNPYTMIAEGSMFYTDMVIDCDMLDIFYNVDNDY